MLGWPVSTVPFPMRTWPASCRRRGAPWLLIAACLFAGGCAPGRMDGGATGMSVPAAAPAAAPGRASARVWFLRPAEPGGAPPASILINGAPLPGLVAGTAFYHDLAPGTYTIAVAGCTRAPAAAQTLQLVGGMQSNLEILPRAAPECGPGRAFSLAPIPADRARVYLGGLTNLGRR